MYYDFNRWISGGSDLPAQLIQIQKASSAVFDTGAHMLDKSKRTLLSSSPSLAADVVELPNPTVIQARLPQFSPELIAARQQLETDGFAIAAGTAVRSVLGEHFDLMEILEAVRAAPVDRYDRTGSRQKLYSQVIRHPNGTLSVLPPCDDGANSASYTTYFQALHFNREFGNLKRQFAPFPATVLGNPTLQVLINLCFAMIPQWRLKGDARNSVFVGVHGQRLKSDGRRAVMSSPPHLHIDGEPHTFVVMLERDNVIGGVSYVALPEAAGKSPEDIDPSWILARGTLMNPLDILAVDDERVSHHVTGVLGANRRPGSRSVLLLDYSEIDLTRTPAPAYE
jgi:hypothetical protein